MNERTHVDLFTGIGGFSLAAASNGVRTIAMCECEPNCRKFLQRAWGLAAFPDVRKFDGKKWRGCWLLTAGVPCQPASRAGQQRGAADDRWLWPEAVRIAKEAGPAWLLFENPPGILDVGLDGILADLERIGYEVQPLSIPACAVNSPQDRERYWIVAHSKSKNRRLSDQQRHSDSESSRPVEEIAVANSVQKQFSRITRTVGCEETMVQGNGETGGIFKPVSGIETGAVADGNIGHRGTKDEIRARGNSAFDDHWSSFEWLQCANNSIRRCPIGLYDMVDGVSTGLLAALGNSIVWPIAAEIIKAMIESENEH